MLRERILREFTPQVARLTLVADPDNLTGEEAIQQALRERGFELLEYGDPVAFRYAYETQYRARWESGEPQELAVIVRGEREELDRLPFDLEQAGRKLAFSLAGLFPNLNYGVVAALDRADLEQVYQAQAALSERLGYHGTCRFLLEKVFPPAPGAIRRPPELLRALIQRHYQGWQLPPALDEYFINELRANPAFQDWPLEEIVPDRAAFFRFLQGHWLPFVRKWLEQKRVELDPASRKHLAEQAGRYRPKIQLDLPFEHPEVRTLMDNLFLEGFLQPVELPAGTLPVPPPGKADWWVGLGLKVNRQLRLEKLLEKLEESLPAAGPAAENFAGYKEWLAFAYRRAELANLWRALDEPAAFAERYRALEAEIDRRFETWARQRYHGLHNLAARQPVMLHQVAERLYRQIAGPGRAKIALVVVDGLALEQWLAIREILAEQAPDLLAREEAIFAWLPTLTAVSRQALFSGKTPNLFPSFLKDTGKEESLWRQFWEERGLSRAEVIYRRGLGSPESLSPLEEALAHPRARVAGLVVNRVDDIMHGSTGGLAGLEREVQAWTRQGFLRDLLNRLLDGGFQVYLTSDHGNIEATGIGNPAQGALAEQAGERVRVYSDPALRATGKALFPAALEWDSTALPQNYRPLLAPGRAAFARAGERLVCHGGISLEELIVPYIQIERKAGN